MLTRVVWLNRALAIAVLTIVQMGALLPFSEASVLSNRSGKSFVFDTTRWVEQTFGDWLLSFSSALSDWPGCSIGSESGRCRVPPTPITTSSYSSSPPSPSPFSHPRSPSAPFFPLCRLSHTVYYGWRCDSPPWLPAGVPL